MNQALDSPMAYLPDPLYALTVLQGLDLSNALPDGSVASDVLQ
jgi:hypothetical protein